MSVFTLESRYFYEEPSAERAACVASVSSLDLRPCQDLALCLALFVFVKRLSAQQTMQLRSFGPLIPSTPRF